MKLLTSIATVLALSLPLTACDGPRALFGDSNPFSYDNGRYNSPNNYPHRPASAVSSDPNYHRGAANATTSTNANAAVDGQKSKSDVTMVEHGNSTATNPKPATVGKGVVTHEGPMVPGEAPSVQ